MKDNETLNDLRLKQFSILRNRAAAKKWREANRDRAKENNKRWREAHRDQVRAQHRRYMARPEVRARAKEYIRRWQQSPKGKASLKRYRLAHPRPYWETGQLKYKCVECDCKFLADRGDHRDDKSYYQKRILCDYCIAELEDTDEAPVMPADIIEYYHETHWLAALLVMRIEYGHNPLYFYCPEE